MSGSATRFICLLALLGAGLAFAADSPARYRYGDDLRWADPKLDDSSWAATVNGLWPRPPFQGSGFMWARFRVPVPSDYSGPLALRLLLEFASVSPNEIWVNGHKIGGLGKFPPAPPYFRVRPATTVFDLPPGTAAPGQTALVALRIWYPSGWRVGSQLGGGFHFEIGSRELLRTRERPAIAEDRLSWSVELVVQVIYILLSAGLLLAWRVGRGSRDLFWFAIYQLLTGVQGAWYLVPDLFRPNLSWVTWFFWYCLVRWLFWVALLEFLWAAFRIRLRWPLRLWQLHVALLYVLFFLVPSVSVSAPWLPVADIAWRIIGGAGLVAIALISLWSLRRSPETRGVAIAMFFLSVMVILNGGTLGQWSIPHTFRWGTEMIYTSEITNLIVLSAVGYMLLRRLWKDWRRGRELDAEFQAAHEMQRVLVPPAAGSVSFTVASEYLPAKQVGGDFFWTIPGEHGSLLLVAGDVSGKGLKAAMTVATLAGALRNETSRQPGKVLAHLNSVLVGHGGTGFTTCCAALFETDGRVTIANAGHLPPYRNGEELQVEPGLPLGLIAEPEYAETTFTLIPGDRITFVSDGVVEARNASGELYGFDRTRALSAQSAAEIAGAAQAFGQEDDISVITIQRTAAAYAL